MNKKIVYQASFCVALSGILYGFFLALAATVCDVLYDLFSFKGSCD